MANLIAGPMDGERVKSDFTKLWFRLDQMVAGSVALWAKYLKQADGHYHYAETIPTTPLEIKHKQKAVGGARVCPERYGSMRLPPHDKMVDLTVWSIVQEAIDK